MVYKIVSNIIISHGVNVSFPAIRAQHGWAKQVAAKAACMRMFAEGGSVEKRQGDRSIGKLL